MLKRSDIFGSSETANLIYIFAAGLSGSMMEFIIRVVALWIYVAGIVLATLAGKKCKNGDCRYLSIGIDVLCCLILAQIPASVDPVMALYPMFFATAFQWLAFNKAGEFSSATIFNTNNVRQCFAGLTEYCCEHNPQELRRFFVFGGSIIWFHAGVIYAWFCMRAWGLASIYACLPLCLLGCMTTWIDCHQRKKQQCFE